MSRIAKRPILVPFNVEIKLDKFVIFIKGKSDELSYTYNRSVNISYINNILRFQTSLKKSNGWAQAGTTRSIVNSMILGVTKGFFKKLQLNGVGYRITLKESDILILSLGYSHNIEYKLPIGVTIDNLTQNEITLKSANKQLIGQIAANLRSYRTPEPYKGKGIRYDNEIIRIKEAKKK